MSASADPITLGVLHTSHYSAFFFFLGGGGGGSQVWLPSDLNFALLQPKVDALATRPLRQLNTMKMFTRKSNGSNDPYSPYLQDFLPVIPLTKLTIVNIRLPYAT